MTPQAIFKARFAELAEALQVGLSVRRQTGKFYALVTGKWERVTKFKESAFPGAWMTSGTADETTFGLPLEEVERVLGLSQVDPAWLQHHDGAPLRIAEQIRRERAFADLPILADALEEGGCTLADVLEHCRAAAPHQQTCWVLELLLGPKRQRRAKTDFG